MAEENPSAPRYQFRGQYIKDLSFENPRAPQSLVGMKEAPKIDVNVELKANRMQDDLYELTMHLAVRATQERTTLFMVDLAYASVIEISNIPEQNIEPLLMVDSAFLLFPFARQIISDVTRNGGFPPLNLEPIDFGRLYAENRQNAPA